MSDTIIGYEPSIQDHPAYEDVEVDFNVGDVVETLKYGSRKPVRNDRGETIGVIKSIGRVREEDDEKRHSTMGDKIEDARGNFNGFEQVYFDPTDPDDIPDKLELTSAYHVVREIDGFRVKVAWGNKDDKTKWIPRERIVGKDIHQKAKFEYQAVKQRRWHERIQERKQTDMDTLMEDVVVPHARKVVNDVWPGGTVDVGEIDFFWNPQLTRCAGKAYWGSAVPETMASGEYAIGLAPDYYYQRGIEELLSIVRHECCHIWQYMHPDCDGGGHGPKFKQWIEDLDTTRHCKNWSKE